MAKKAVKECEEIKKEEEKKPVPAEDQKEQPKEEPKDEPKKEEPAAEEPKKDESEDHPDEEKDIELIKKMIAKYLGDEDIDSEEVMKLAKEAFGHAKEMGLEGEEAEKCAGYAVKMAKHVAKKEEAKETEEVKEEPKKEEPKEEAKEECKEECDDEKKESEKVLELTGQVAKLTESLKKFEIKEYLDKALRESKLPMSATKKFREALGEPKNNQEIDAALKVFKAGWQTVGGEANMFESLVLATEKAPMKTGGEISFADCLK